MPPALLELDRVTIQYKSAQHLVTALYRVSFEAHAADRFVIVGPSGCGKTTLLKAVAGFVKPVEGAIRLSGRPVAKPGPDRVMVFQEFDQLLPWKTVRQNVVFPLMATGACRRRDAEARALAFLAMVKLEGFADAYPHTLSGGMKQRVALARAMAMQPAVLLMDEPFAALDALTRRRMQDELLRLWDEMHFTVLFVTHSIEEAIIIGSRILVLSAHPGQVRAELNGAGGPRDPSGSAAAGLRERIHGMLLAESVSQDGAS